MLWWTLQNVVIAAILAVLVQLVCRVWRVGPVGRHALWLIVLVKLLTPPVVTLKSPWVMPLALSGTSTSPLDGPAAAADIAPARGPGVETPAVAQPLPPMRTMPALVVVSDPEGRAAISLVDALRRALVIAGIVWIVGAILFALFQLVRVLRIVLLLRGAAPPDAGLQSEVDALARQIGVRPVGVRVVPGLMTPLIWSGRPWRPLLLWPAQLPEMPAECVRGLIVHELAHVKRRDHWVGWIELIAGCVWWWNPVFWYARFHLRESAELACDGWVVDALPRGRRAYAEALIAVCAGVRPQTAPMLAAGVTSGSRKALERRLIMIIRGRVPVRLTRSGWVAIGVVALAVMPAWAAGQATTPPKQTTPPREPRVVVVPTPTEQQQMRVYVGNDSSLPEEAKQLLKQSESQQDAIRKDANSKLAEERADLIKRLQSLQESLARANKLDEAVAVRNQIRRMQRTTGGLDLVEYVGRWEPGVKYETNIPVEYSRAISAGWPVELRAHELSHEVKPDGRNYEAWISRDGHASSFSMGSYRDRIGESLIMPVIGSTKGHVWGDRIYTDDSDLATAAVHAGLVAEGEFGLVRATIRPGQTHYSGATRRGIHSEDYDHWDGSFELSAVPKPWPSEIGPIRLHDGRGFEYQGLLKHFRDTSLKSVIFDVEGTTDGAVWGTDVYTDDSSVAAAAVHAGLLRVGERGRVRVTLLPGRDTYVGSRRNGLRTENYGKFDGSFQIERVSGAR